MPYLTTPTGRLIPWREGAQLSASDEDLFRGEQADYQADYE